MFRFIVLLNKLFLVMRLGITIAMSCGSLVVILVPLLFPSLKLEHGLQKYVCSVTEIKYGFVKLAVIF